VKLKKKRDIGEIEVFALASGCEVKKKRDIGLLGEKGSKKEDNKQRTDPNKKKAIFPKTRNMNSPYSTGACNCCASVCQRFTYT